jgi:acetyl/propionyl-CoA carboxylase alpha subunit
MKQFALVLINAGRCNIIAAEITNGYHPGYGFFLSENSKFQNLWKMVSSCGASLK